MPARSSLAPGRLPIRLSHLLRLPKHEVGRILLLFLTGNLEFTKSRLEILHIFMGKLSVGLKRCCIIINRTVYGISKALLFQLINQVYHAVNFFGCFRVSGGFFNVEIRHVLLHFGNITLGYSLAVYAFLYRSFNNLVVYIGIVRNIFYLISLVLHKTTKSIKYNHRTRISDMNKVVNGRPADIHSDLSFFNRNELFLLLRHGIINLHKFLFS